MPMIPINASRPDLAGISALAATGGAGPVIVMIHGYKYQPDHPTRCPHRRILSLNPATGPSWPRKLGFGANAPDEGVGIAFGWPARGSLRQARQRAVAAGRVLASLLGAFPARRIHMVAHSLGTEVAFEALSHLPAGSVGRIIAMTAASYQSRAIDAMHRPAGRGAELFNITSRENDPFDFLFERLIAPPCAGDRAIGQGLDIPNAVTLQLDCPNTLTRLRRLGMRIGAPEKRVCHWSAYTRPGVLDFYRELLRRPGDLDLTTIRRGLPQRATARWSRLFARPNLTVPLPFAQKHT